MLRAKAFVRVVANGEPMHLDELPPKANLAKTKELLIVADRLTVDPAARTRFTDAFETAFLEGDGDATAIVIPPDAPERRLRFTTRFECPNDGHTAPAPSPQLFSFNNPRGACAVCNGFGATLEYDEALIIPYPERTLREGAIDPWTMPRYDNKRLALAEFAKKIGRAHV